MIKMSRINENDVYVPVSPDHRLLIIQQIHNKQLTSGRKRGMETDYKWWLGKHHPEKEIPTEIYLLGRGTVHEQYERYKKIDLREFMNYRRELIYQGILVKC